MRFVLVALFVLLTASVGRSAIIFSVTQRTPGDIPLGSTAIFDVSIATDATTGTVNNLTGVSFYLSIDNQPPQSSAGGNISGGQFVLATNDTANALSGGRSYLFTPADGQGFLNHNGGGSGGEPSQLAYSSSLASGTRTISTTPAFLGSFSIDTSVGKAGTHTLDFDFDPSFPGYVLTLTDPQFEVTAGLNAPSLTYTLSAVPEPTSMLLLGLACVGGMVGNRFARARSKA